MKEQCHSCKKEMDRRYFPMKEWGISGPLCGGCYSAKIADFYPGVHARTGSQGGGKENSGGLQGGERYIQIDKPGGGQQA